MMKIFGPDSSRPFLMKTYPYREEVANSITHGIGLAGSIIGFIILLQVEGNATDLFILWIFGISMILCYATSTLYHSLVNKKAKFLMKIADHAAIYLLIAGTYGPFSLYVIGGLTGILMMVVIWSIAIIGVIFKIFFINRFQLLSTYLYLGMGWMAIFAIKPILNNLSTEGIWLLIAGGLSYSIGVIFFLWNKLPYNHAIWHVFVLGGSLCHFLCVWYHVIPLRLPT